MRAVAHGSVSTEGRSLRIGKGVLMDVFTAVVDAYDAARVQGQSRADAFLCAVTVYNARHPELPVSEAGYEVARILRLAAEHANMGNAVPTGAA